MKVIFLGTPEFGKIVLEKLLSSKHQVVAVVCQEDKPTGRGNKITMPPVKVLAIKNNIPVYQFKKIRIDGVDTLKALKADIMVTAAYGQILSQEIIDICPHKIINVHGSLLPKYRGATPIQQSIIDGESETGVTIMQTEAGIDTGDIILQQSLKIEQNDTYGTLSQKLAEVGGDLVVKALDLIEIGKATFTKQNETLATHTKMIKKDENIIDFYKTAIQIVNFVRGLNPNPVAIFKIKENSFKVFSAQIYQNYNKIENYNSYQIGQVVLSSAKKGLVIKCNGGAVEIIEMLAPNSKMMLAKNYLNGKSIEVGAICNE